MTTDRHTYYGDLAVGDDVPQFHDSIARIERLSPRSFGSYDLRIHLTYGGTFHANSADRFAPGLGPTRLDCPTPSEPGDVVCVFDRHPLHFNERVVQRRGSAELLDDGTVVIGSQTETVYDEDNDDEWLECPHCLAAYHLPDTYEWS